MLGVLFLTVATLLLAKGSFGAIGESSFRDGAVLFAYGIPMFALSSLGLWAVGRSIRSVWGVPLPYEIGRATVSSLAIIAACIAGVSVLQFRRRVKDAQHGMGTEEIVIAPVSEGDNS